MQPPATAQTPENKGFLYLSVCPVRENLRVSCIPETMLNGQIPAYHEFLEQRRKLMAQKMKTYFQTL